MGDPLEIVLKIIVLSFWFLFPIGIFLSVSHVDKNTDQVVRLDQLRHYPEEEPPKKKVRVKKRSLGRPHVANIPFRRSVRH